MPRKKEKKHHKKVAKLHKVSAKASNKIHIEIHNHSKKRGKAKESTPRMPQFIPMGGGSTIVNNIPSQDYPNFQMMHQQASYENIIKNLAAEIQAIKLGVPSANHEAIATHVESIKNEIDNVVKPEIKLNIPGTEETPKRTYNNDLFNDSPLDASGFTPTFINTSVPSPQASTISTPSFSFSFPTPQSAPRPALTMDFIEPTTYRVSGLPEGGLQLSMDSIEATTYKPSPLDIASMEYKRIQTYSQGDVRNTLLKDTAEEYGRAVKNKELVQYVNKLNKQGRGGYYPKLDQDFQKILNNDLITKYGPGNAIKD